MKNYGFNNFDRQHQKLNDNNLLHFFSYVDVLYLLEFIHN